MRQARLSIRAGTPVSELLNAVPRRFRSTMSGERGGPITSGIVVRGACRPLRCDDSIHVEPPCFACIAIASRGILPDVINPSEPRHDEGHVGGPFDSETWNRGSCFGVFGMGQRVRSRRSPRRGACPTPRTTSQPSDCLRITGPGNVVEGRRGRSEEWRPSGSVNTTTQARDQQSRLLARQVSAEGVGV